MEVVTFPQSRLTRYPPFLKGGFCRIKFDSTNNRVVGDLCEAIRKLDDDKPLTQEQKIKTLNILNTIRVINALAIIADIHERLRVIADPDEIMVDVDDEDSTGASAEDQTIVAQAPPEAITSTNRYLNIPLMPLLNSLSALQKK